jgi:hypothetical protein
MNGIPIDNHSIDPIIYGYPWTIVIILKWNYVYQWKGCSISLQAHMYKGYNIINVQLQAYTNYARIETPTNDAPNMDEISF